MKDYSIWLDWRAVCRYLFPNAHRKTGRRSRWHAAAGPHGTLSYLSKSIRRWKGGNVRPPLPQGWPAGGRLSSCWQLGFPIRGGAGGGRATDRGAPLGQALSRPASGWPLRRPWPRSQGRFFPQRWRSTSCAWPANGRILLGRSLSQGDCTELARQLIAEGIVANISAATVRRILAAHHLKPWRQHVWLYPKQPRDAAFYATVSELMALYTRPRGPDERVLSVDEKTSLQPRPRQHPTQPAQPKNVPTRCEHEYKRAGALISLRLLTPGLARSMANVMSGSVSGNASPFWKRWRRRLTSVSVPFISCATMSVPITGKKSANGSPSIRVSSCTLHPCMAHG